MCINILQHPNFNESWKLPSCLPSYKRDVYQHVEAFCTTMATTGAQTGGTIDRGITLAKYILCEIKLWNDSTTKHSNQQLPFPKCKWFHLYQHGFFDIILDKFANNPQTTTNFIIKWILRTDLPLPMSRWFYRLGPNHNNQYKEQRAKYNDSN